MPKTTRHRWTTDDEEALRDAVEVVFRGNVPDSVSRRLAGWSAVAGRLLPDLAVSPDACRTRWQVLLDREREEERVRAAARERAALERQETEDEEAAEEAQERADIEAYASPAGTMAWEDLAQRIARMEMESADELTEALCGLRADVGELDLRVRAWEGRLEAIDAVVEKTGGCVAAQADALEEILRDVRRLVAEWTGASCAKEDR